MPHFRTRTTQQNILMNQIIKKRATELQDSERSLFLKEVSTQRPWIFELGTQEGLNVRIWVFAGFQQMVRKKTQHLNNNNFYGPPVTSAHVLIGKKRCPDNSLLLDYNDDKFSQGYEQRKEAFKASTQDDILQPYKSEDHFRSFNDGDNIGYGYTLPIYDIRKIMKVVNQ